MPSLNCTTYQTLTPLEEVVTLTTTAVQYLFSSERSVLTALIEPHPDNVGTIKIGYATSPQNESPLGLDFMGRSFHYDLAQVRVKASVANDKIIIISQAYP